MRVSMSAMGSVLVIPFIPRTSFPYQLALITPGTSPASASCRKQIRHN
jgi:hypothetical protein